MSIFNKLRIQTKANLIAIAIVGEYVCRIYFQTKNRPLFIVDKVEVSTPPPRDTGI